MCATININSESARVGDQIEIGSFISLSLCLRSSVGWCGGRGRSFGLHAQRESGGAQDSPARPRWLACWKNICIPPKRGVEVHQHTAGVCNNKVQHSRMRVCDFQRQKLYNWSFSLTLTYRFNSARRQRKKMELAYCWKSCSGKWNALKIIALQICNFIENFLLHN